MPWRSDRAPARGEIAKVSPRTRRYSKVVRPSRLRDFTMIRRPRRRTPPSARPRVELLENREALTSLAGPPASFFLGPTPPPSPPTIDGRSMVSSRAVVDATTATIRIAPLASAPIVVEAARLTPSTPTTNPPVVRTDLFGVAGPAILAGDLEFGADVPTLDYRSRSPDPAPLPCADRRWSEP